MAEVSGPDWASTPPFHLSVQNSQHKYIIHRGLLEIISPTIASSKSFKEGKDDHYVFEDTTDSTVIRFIHWAYTHEYTCANTAEQHSISNNTITAAKQAQDQPPEDCRLLSHAQVYVFADTYLIQPLKDYSFEKLTDLIKNLRPSMNGATPRNGKDMQDLMMLFIYVFADRLREDDKLFVWLIDFIAWWIGDLCKHEEFLRGLLPRIARFVVPKLKGMERAPWEPNPKKFLYKCLRCGERYETSKLNCPVCMGYTTVSFRL
ncbi:MAG: hypothetical protein Q9227_004214 [Pyrenula ochraceoflavens]